MYNENRENVFLTGLFAFLFLGVIGYQWINGQLVPTKMIGILVGIFGGAISSYSNNLSKKSEMKILRVFAILFSPLGFICALPFSPAMGGGYFLGSGVTFSLGLLWVSLKKRGHPSRVHKLR